jgi:predicted nucleic acid-binding protein
MNDRPFFDASVFLYAFSQDDSRGNVAQTLLAAGGTYYPLPSDTGIQYLIPLSSLSALHAGAKTLYSEDMRDGQSIDKLTIQNPFSRHQ